MRLDHPPQRGFADASMGAIWWILLAIALVSALWLRLAHLGQMGLARNGDEDIMATAVLGINQWGYPLMPSGMIYLRSAPLLYLMSGTTQLFGFDEFSLRLPAAIFGTLLIPLSWLIASRVMGRRAAVLVALLVALSLWQVDVSRMARMYAMFAFAYGLAIYAMLRGFFEGSAGWRLASIPLAIVAIPIHTLGFTLAACFLLCALAPGRSKNSISVAVLGVLSTAATYFAWSNLEGRMFGRPFGLHALTRPGGYPSGILGQIERRLYLPADPVIPFEGTVPVLVLTLSVLLALTICIASVPPEKRRWPTLMLLAASVLAAALHQFTLVAVFFPAYLLSLGEGARGLLRKDALTVTLAVAVFFVTWIISYASVPASGTAVTAVLRPMFDYPRAEVIRPFIGDRPVLTIFVVIAAVQILNRLSVTRQLAAPSFLVLTMIAALILHGVFQSQFRPRYNFNLDLIFSTLAVYGALTAYRAFSAWIDRRQIAPAGVLRLVSAVGMGVILAIGANVRSAVAYPSLWEGSPERFAKSHGFERPPDRRSPAEYVARRMGAGDQVMSMDWLTTYVYVGQLDYWIRTSKFEKITYDDGSGPRDLYLGALVINDGDALSDAIQAPRSGYLWIVTSSSILRAGRKVNADFLAELDRLAAYRMYTGLDGLSSVYRVPPVIDVGPQAAMAP